MSTYEWTPAGLPLQEDWDVVVAGGGPSGCAAAAAAAREGVRTLLLEATGVLGGMGTSALVPAWCPFTDKEKIIYGGIAETVLRRCSAGMPHVAEDQYDWTPINAERLKRVYDDLMLEHGVEVRFHSLIVDVVRDEQGRVDVLIVAAKNGLTAVRAAVFVDATGDGDVAARAGAEYEMGDEEGDLQPATHCFTLSNVDTYAYEHLEGMGTGFEGRVIHEILTSGKYPGIPDHHLCNSLVGPEAVGFNAGHIWGVDNTDPASVSKALMAGRRMAGEFRDALAEFFPEAFGNAHLIQTGSLLGVRETRRILGDYVLVLEDFVECRSFPDEICRNAYFLDTHHRKSDVGTANEDMARAIHLPPGASHGIPYRCLTPKQLQNVLVAGRCISTDRAVQGSTRVMPVCLCMGEAAGVAAAFAARSEGPNVHRVDTRALRAALKTYGAYLPD